MPRTPPKSLYFIPAILLALPAQAQDPVKQRFAETQSHNAAELRQYGWTSRTALKLKDKVREVRWEAVHYDHNGQLQKTAVSDPNPAPASDEDKTKPKPMDEKKRGEMKGLLGDLTKLARSYAHLTPAQTEAFAHSCTLSEDPGGNFQLQGGDLVAKGDHLILRIDAASFLMRQLDIETFYKHNPVTIIVSFTMLSDGVAYPSLVNVVYPKKDIEVIVQNLNYQRLHPTPPTARTGAMLGSQKGGD